MQLSTANGLWLSGCQRSSNHLRKDPMFNTGLPVASPLNAEAHLASAPTYSRLGKGLSRKDNATTSLMPLQSTFSVVTKSHPS